MKPSWIADKTVCRDGTVASIQASEYHYCSPRQADCAPYFSVEVGFIEKDNETVTPPESWRQYADGSDFPSAVYGYVPTELVREFITEHGGAEVMPPALREH